MTQSTIIDKILIKGKIKLLTGLHIGASNDFAPIGAVDSIIVRNPIDRRPIIPGSTLKGKMRNLLVKANSSSCILDSIEKDSIEIKRLFGASSPEIIISRLQFCDSFLSEKSVNELKDKTDLYLTEIKFENNISRTTAVANPRQLERVPMGAEFSFHLIYNLEDTNELYEDFENISKGLKLLHMDYIGGSGSRGYGKIKFLDFSVTPLNITNKSYEIDVNKLQQILEESEDYVLSL